MASAQSGSGTGVVTQQRGPILVIGATGNQGGQVVRTLQPASPEPLIGQRAMLIKIPLNKRQGVFC
jgi:hypothetical protein